MNAFTQKPNVTAFLRTQQNLAGRSQRATQQVTDPLRKVNLLNRDPKKAQVKA